MPSPQALSPQQAMSAGRKLESDGRLADAEAMYRRIVEQQPAFHPAYHALALLAHKFDKLELAAELLSSAIALAEDVPVYHRDRGEICRRIGRLDDAVREARRAVALNRNEPESHYNLGLALADQEDAAAALVSYQRAVSLNPKHGQALNNMGSVLEAEERETEAEASYRNAISIDPRHTEALNNLGSLLSKDGRIDEARDLFEQSLAVDPAAVTSHYNLSSLKRYRADDPHTAALESLAESADSLPMPERAQYHFTLGKARDDCGRYDEAFAAYSEGNRLKQAEVRDTDVQGERQVEAIISHFSPEFIAQSKGAGCPDEAPIFIVGMPRSGTSLIEQILASHAQVHGAGELKELHNVVGERLGVSPERPFAELASKLRPEDLDALGTEYANRLRERSADAARITDKMPANFHYLGLIYLALPNAKVIHSARDPMDSCLSCYTRLFNDTMAFTYDLGTLGRYYVRYMRMMRHWRDVLPDDFILEMPYEELVEDVEGQTRRMLEHIGLPWDDNCLKFYDNTRPVRTASLAQVRKPIYKSSVGGWKRFEQQLVPLLDIVKDYR